MDINGQIAQIASTLPGDMCLAAKCLATGQTVAVAPDRWCATASVIKLPILVHTLMLAQEGRISLDEMLTVRAQDRVGGSGLLTHLTDGHRLSLLDACRLMITLSDNTATNMVLDVVNISAVNERMESLGLSDTRLYHKVFRGGDNQTEEEKLFGLGRSTPNDMVRLLELLHAGHAGGPVVCERARQILALQFYRDGIPRYLGADCQYAGKTGALDQLRNDVGLVTLPGGRTIALAVFCFGISEVLWTADNPGYVTIARVSQAIVQHFLQS